MEFIRRGLIRALALMLGLMCTVTLLLPALAAESAMPSQEETYAVPVRNSSYAGSAVIGQMENGTVLSIQGQTGDFYKVDCYGRMGYLAKEYVSVNRNGEYYVNCGRDTEGATPVVRMALTDVLSLRSQILDWAKAQLGTPYVYGGATPRGFDCSGYVYYIYGKQGYDLNRCADTQMQDGTVVTKDGLQVGDLVFFRDPWSPWLASHVGIYVGGGKMLHAGSNGIGYASLDDEYYASRYVGARRIIHADAAEIQQLPTAVKKANMQIRSLGLRSVN